MTQRIASRRHALLLALSALTALSAPAAHADDAYPGKPITLVVPYPAGGADKVW